DTASSSVLKLVRTIQKIGKKIRSPTIQAKIEKPRWQRAVCLFSISCPLPVQVLANEADQEERHDSCQNDSNDTARRCTANVVLQQGLGIDEEGNIGGCKAGATAGCHENLGKDGQQENCFDQ